MSNFLIFKAAFNNSATPAIGTYTAEGATAQFNRNTDISPDYYLYGNTSRSAIRWFVPTKETTDFEFVADILTTEFNGRFTYFIIADSTGTTRLRMWSLDNWVFFANDDSSAQTGTQYIGSLSDNYIGGFEVFHRFRVRVRKLTASSSSVEIYVDGTRKLTATAGAALVTCAKIGFMGGINDSVPLGTSTGIQNTYLYDLSGGDVIDRGVLSGAFNRFISWMKSKFALKSDIPTVNNGTLTIQKNGTNVATFTANQSTAATANIVVPTAVSELTNDSGYLTSSSNLDASKLTSGTVDIARLPQGALERLVKVANEAARYALTTADVQLGDTVQQLDTGIMYIVIDADHLDSAAGYTEYTAGTAASVPWSGVTGKPTFAAVATSGAYSDLIGTPTIPTVNDATLTIQQNGTTVDTFTANSSSDKTVNIQCVDLTNNQTVAGNKEFTGTTTAHDVVPSATDTYNLGGPSYQWNNAYIKSLTINGVACGDILTHNASEFVNVSGNQTIAGIKTFSNDIRINKASPFCNVFSSGYIKGQAPSSNIYSGVRFFDDINSGSVNTITGGFEVEYNRDGYNKSYISSRNYAGETNKVFTVGLRVPNDDIRSIDFLPSVSNIVNLGTSTNKWKSLNGINPGALSLPSSTYVNVDTTNWDLTCQNELLGSFTPTADGWLMLQINNVSEASFWIIGGVIRINNKSSINTIDNNNFNMFTIPVEKDVTYNIYGNASEYVAGRSIAYCRFMPCRGNI